MKKKKKNPQNGKQYPAKRQLKTNIIWTQECVKAKTKHLNDKL